METITVFFIVEIIGTVAFALSLIHISGGNYDGAGGGDCL